MAKLTFTSDRKFRCVLTNLQLQLSGSDLQLHCFLGNMSRRYVIEMLMFSEIDMFSSICTFIVADTKNKFICWQETSSVPRLNMIWFPNEYFVKISGAVYNSTWSEFQWYTWNTRCVTLCLELFASSSCSPMDLCALTPDHAAYCLVVLGNQPVTVCAKVLNCAKYYPSWGNSSS